MSLLRLDLQAVEAAKSQVNQGRLKLSQLDGRLPTVEYAIGARRGIQGRMNQAARRMRELEHKVQELSSFIHRAQGQYSEVESALTAMAQALQHHRSLNAGQGEQTVGNAETRPKQGAHHVTILSSIMEWLASNKDKPQQMNTTAMRAGMLGGDSSTPGLQDGYFPFNPFRPFDFSTYQRSDQDLYGQINGCPAPSDAMQFYMQVEQTIQDVKWKVVEGVGSFVQGGIDAFVGTYDGVMDIAKNIKEGNFEDLPSFLTNNPEKQREEAQAFIDEINERVINGDANSRFNYAGGVVIPSLLAAGLGRTLMQVLKKAPDVPKLPKKEPIPSKVDVEKPKVQEPLKPDRDKPVGSEGTGEGNKPNFYDKDGNYTGGRTQKELDDLAGDPSHGGKIRDQGLKEREIGLDLEQQGKLGKIVRDPQGNGGAEFIDTTNNVKWDVKSFVSYPNGHTSPKKGAFTVNNGMKAINKELDKTYNVIVDKRDMIPEHVEQLREAIEKAWISDRILWYP